jgi:P-loop Domain of unknown function (DUF2791)
MPAIAISPQRRDEILDALRRGTVPASSLDILAVGLEPFEATLRAELDTVRAGRGTFKAVRGEYGSGKTFFARWFEEVARREGFATSEVQISETETPLHRLETVYRLVEQLATIDCRTGALRSVIDGWFFTLEEEVMEGGDVPASDAHGILARTNVLMEQRLAVVTRMAPTFATCLRGYRQALASGDREIADGLMAWLSGLPNVSAQVKRHAGIKGEIDHFGAMNFLQGVLTVLRDSGYPGLVLVLDEVETLQRMRGDVREKALNALRQLIDEVDTGRFPGLYLLITGTPAFFDSPQGAPRLPPLMQRLHVDFTADPRFDNPRAVQIRLPGFDLNKLRLVGCKVRDLYAAHCPEAGRILRLADDRYIADLSAAVAGALGGKIGITPRVYLKKLVGEVLDRIDQFPDFDPRRHYALTIADAELTEVERNARAAAHVDEIELDV